MCQELLLKKKKKGVSDSKEKANRQRRAEKADSERQPFIVPIVVKVSKQTNKQYNPFCSARTVFPRANSAFLKQKPELL